MIKSEHSKWAEFIFDFYLDRLLRKHFHSFLQIGQSPVIDINKSLLILPNHISWWDGFFIYKIIKQFSDKKFHIMMLEEQLRKYWFFKKLGAYSIAQNNPKSILESLNYTLQLLRTPKNLCVFYPQGEIQLQDELDVKFNRGVNYICDKSETEFQILCIGFRIIYTNKKLPYVVFRFGDRISSLKVKNDDGLIKNSFQGNLINLFDNKNLPSNIFN